MLTSERKKPKRSKIRYAEYYDLQKTLDSLYADSSKGKVFVHLMELISSEENIRMAYRTIKGNTGSSTAGVDKRTIQDLAKLNEEKYVALIQKQFKSYHPRPVRRVEIPKPNGKTRPLGIPTIVDRIVQQCVLQVLEPICEAKFYDHSYGFRPNRSTEHAIARCDQLIQLSHLYYVVDIDIKGFFDNVNHTKLIQQMWEMGIQDKRLLCIIREIYLFHAGGKGAGAKHRPRVSAACPGGTARALRPGVPHSQRSQYHRPGQQVVRPLQARGRLCRQLCPALLPSPLSGGGFAFAGQKEWKIV